MTEGETPANETTVDETLQFLRTKLADVCISPRNDLATSRHVFRGQPSYIVHDPLTNNSHRLAVREYQILASLNRQQTLSRIFDQLVADGLSKESDEQRFYEFVLDLQARSLLDLPITDTNKLYDRFAKSQVTSVSDFATKLMFLRIPLVNPNNFLDRTVDLARPLFTRWFFVLWCILGVSSMAILFARWSDFVSPFANLLATRNLIILVVVMTALKVWHELGHAYACKISGGVVPDMGAFFMVGLPMAYVDVSSSWSFASQRRRMLVGLGGMYFESIAAAIAVFVWAATGPGIVNSAAHFVVLMASLVTVIFNANPLMRYDGYYILSDMLGVPNLRQRSTDYLKNIFKKYALGLSTKTIAKTKSDRVIFISYGIAAAIYQIFLVAVITLMMASQFLLVGAVLGSLFFFKSIVNPVVTFYRYLLVSKETGSVRSRAKIWGGSLAAAAFMLLLVIPMPGGTIVQGQLGFEHSQIIRLPFDCTLNQVCVTPNQQIDQSHKLLEVENFDVKEQFQLASAKLHKSKAALLASSESEPVLQHKRFFEFENAQQDVNVAQSYMKQMNVESSFAGRVLSCPQSIDVGRYYKAGEELAHVGKGANVVQCLLSSEQLRAASPEVGQAALIRLKSGSTASRDGKITRVEPAGSKLIKMHGLTQLAQGDILIDPSTGISQHPYFMVEITLDENVEDEIPVRTTASVRLGSQYATVGGSIIRRLRILVNQINAEN